MFSVLDTPNEGTLNLLVWASYMQPSRTIGGNEQHVVEYTYS